MLRLEELTKVFGGRVRTLGARTWLDTRVGGLRTFVIRRITEAGTITFDLAVFTPYTREQDPFFAREEGELWCLADKARHSVPHLKHGFVFAGCPRGILFARNTTEPSLEGMVGTLWELAAWARKPWRPTMFSDGLTHDLRDLRYSIRRIWDRWQVVIVLVAALALWLLLG